MFEYVRAETERCKPMSEVVRVFVLCEFSGEVRDAFAHRGCDAWSCDFLPSKRGGQHFQTDCRNLNYAGVELVIAFPPCTYLARSGARWWRDRKQEQVQAIDFVLWIAGLPVPKIAIENPIGILSTVWRKPDQIIQPWQFGHGETKATCLWLKGLAKLKPTNIVAGRDPRIHWMAPSPSRGQKRSQTYHGIAQAMAEQWAQARKKRLSGWS